MKKHKVPAIIVATFVGMIGLTAVERGLLPALEKYKSERREAAGTALSDTSVQRGNLDVEAYARITDLFQRGSDAAADSRLADALQRDILIEDIRIGDTGVLENESSSGLLLKVDKELLDRAEQATAAGHTAEAERWLRDARSLPVHVLETSKPTIAALILAHMQDEANGRAERKILQKQGASEAASRVTRRLNELKAVWQSRVFVPVRKLRSERMVKEFDILRRNDPAHEDEELREVAKVEEQSEGKLAAGLLPLYRNERRRWTTATTQ